MHHFKFYGAATVGTKGQIVIPAEAREELKMGEGDKVVIVKAHHHNGLLLLNAEVLENHLADMQAKLKNQKEL
ncbi:MAG TPA: AbrB/MazE/SpoVT family DNA-binding domain-containing protein [Candidatus Saccharimonadales bacterium]|nr:AbrB/MazE/SpoVT family DNA-binding domain-containing protein [Candidatus Saccharimonadales bacterium]